MADYESACGCAPFERKGGRHLSGLAPAEVFVVPGNCDVETSRIHLLSERGLSNYSVVQTAAAFNVPHTVSLRMAMPSLGNVIYCSPSFPML